MKIRAGANPAYLYRAHGLQAIHPRHGNVGDDEVERAVFDEASNKLGASPSTCHVQARPCAPVRLPPWWTGRRR